MIPVAGKQYSTENYKKSFQGTSKKTLSKKSKQSNDSSHSNNIARTIFHIFGIYDTIFDLNCLKFPTFANLSVFLTGHKSNSHMSQSFSPPQLLRQHVPCNVQPVSQSFRRKEACENMLLVKNTIPKRSDSSSVLDSDVGSTKSGGRRPSIDTVSTYLSHDSELRASTSHVISLMFYFFNVKKCISAYQSLI